MAFRRISLVHASGNSGVNGEVVVETALAWQIAVSGKVGVYEKSDYIETPIGDRSFADIFDIFGNGSRNVNVRDIFGWG